MYPYFVEMLMEIFGWSRDMKNELNGKAINEIVGFDRSLDEKAITGPELSVKLGIDGSNSDHYAYANRCIPWRYVEIFKNMTIRP